MSTRRRWGVIGAFALLAAVRVLIAWRLPLTDDEAYYWIWSQRLAWGYPDHPPVIAVLIRLTTVVFGTGPLAIRLGPLILTLATGPIVYALGRDMFTPTVGLVAALTSQLFPIVAAGGVLAVPDAPFIFFWVLAIWLFWRARSTGAGAYWYATGTALGLTVMSKLFGGLLAAGLAAFLLASPQDRKWLRRSEPYVAAVIGVAIIAPFIWWNIVEGWPSWVKITHQIPWIRIGSPGYKTLAYVLAQFAYYGPMTAPLLIVALAAAVRRARTGDPRFALLAWVALPLLVIPFVMSPGGMPKPHWPVPAYLLAGVASAALWWEGGRYAMQRLYATALGVNALFLAVILMQPWAAPAALDQAKGWDQVISQVDEIARALPHSPGVFIFSTGYQTASQLTYRLSGRYPVTAASTDTELARTIPLRRFIGWNGVYVDDDREPIGIPITVMFRSVERLAPITVAIAGRVSRRFVVYRGIDFRGLPPER